MPRCAHCGSPDVVAGLDHWHCYTCGKLTNMATGRGPAEGQFYNNDALDGACRDWVTANRPDILRMLADTVAGQPDQGTEPGGTPVTDQPIEPTEPTEPAEDEVIPTDSTTVTDEPAPESEPEPAESEPTEPAEVA